MDQNNQPLKAEEVQMCYSIEPRDRIYVKSYEYLSYPKNISKKLSN